MKKTNKKNWFKRGCGDEKCDCGCGCHCHKPGCAGAVYGLGFIGSVVYFISTAPSFWMGVLGVLKALVWPAILAYGMLKQLGM